MSVEESSVAHRVASDQARRSRSAQSALRSGVSDASRLRTILAVPQPGLARAWNRSASEPFVRKSKRSRKWPALFGVIARFSERAQGEISNASVEEMNH